MWLIGVLLVAFGVVGLLTGGGDFAADPVDGDVSGEVLLGIEANGWTNALFIMNGLALVIAAISLVGTSFVAVVIGLDFAAAAVAAAIDGSDVLGVWATNGATRIVWAGLAVILLALSALMLRATRGRTASSSRAGS